MEKVLLWGAGDRSRKFIRQNLFERESILAVVDSYCEQGEVEGYTVIRPEALGEYEKEAAYIVICNQFFLEITVQLLELGISSEKIVITDNVKEKPYSDYYLRLKQVFPKVYEITRHVLIRAVKSNERDDVDAESFLHQKQFKDMEYRNDYFRYRTFEFVADEMEEKQVEGALAELGVFRGKFSALLNHRFPERKLYLFDTFEGFDEAEAQKELERGRCGQSFIESHKDTSVELMLSNLPYPDRAVVCRGFFPDSISEDAGRESFAFVSLDVDFEESTYEGLKFFYPRLAEGGYIFIHDYNTYYLDGVRIALRRYEEYMGKKLKTVPLADRAGTLVIVK